MDSLRKSFKRNSSHKNVGRKSGGEQEAQLILFDDEQDAPKSIHPDSDRREVVVKIDGSNGGSRDIELSMEPNSKISKGSYDFLNDGNGTEQQQKQQQQQTDTDEEFFFQQQSFNGDIPKLIAQFQEKEAVGKTSGNLELELEAALMDQLPPVNEDPKEQQPITSKELRVSFQAPSLHHNENNPENIRRRSRSLWDEDNNNKNKYPDAGEVLKCSANSSFKQYSSLMRSKTKSRLIDPPLTEDNLHHSGINLSKSLKSGMLGKDDDDEDPFLDEDLPSEFKKGKLRALTILEWLSFIAILVTFICTLKIRFLNEIEVWNLSLWRWEVLVLVLISGRLVSGWGIRIIVFFIERNFLLRKRVLYFVYALRNVVQNCLWLGLVLITWTIIFNEKDEGQIKSKVLPYITKILICLLVGTLLWLVKTILVKVLASSFHVSTYFDRIQDSLFNQYVIETLSGPPLVEIQNTKEEEGRLMAEIQRLQNAGAKIPPNLKAAAFPGKSMQAIGSGGYQKNEVIGKSFKLSGAGSKQLDEGITIDRNHSTSLLLFISLSSFFFIIDVAAAAGNSPSTGLKKEKMSHLRFFFHDIVGGPNATAIRVAGAPTTDKSPTLFGAVVMIDDLLTIGPSPKSKLVGRAQGLYASASQDNLALLMAMNFAFMDGKYNGSTLSILGRNSVFSDVREMPVIGGSGLFRFARGYALAHTRKIDFETGDAVVEYNVYVMHY